MMRSLYIAILIGLIFAGSAQSFAQSDVLKERYAKNASLNKAIEAVSAQFKRSASHDHYTIVSEKRIAKYEANIDELLQTRDASQRELMALKEQQTFLERGGVNLHSAAGLEQIKYQEEQLLKEFVAYVQARKQAARVSSTALRLLRPLDERVQTALRERVLLRARSRLLSFVNTAPEILQKVEEAEGKYEEAQLAYDKAVKEYENAQDWLVMSDNRRRRIAGEVAAVQSKVLALQAELDRIDARLQRQAERTLIEKGLITSREGKHTSGQYAQGDSLGWPVKGRISAGFFDAAYKRYFGFPHKAIDIVVTQGTPVGSAANGIVYFVQDGGPRGYSYILIGHRGGYATVYGHMLSIYVKPGEEVYKGQTIGLSGGRPGSYGAGFATTGDHLHFEIIRNGVHVDPLTVL